jgi:hypothetical protein
MLGFFHYHLNVIPYYIYFLSFFFLFFFLFFSSSLNNQNPDYFIRQ